MKSRVCPLDGGVTWTSLKIIFRFSKINSKPSQLIHVSGRRSSSVRLLCVFIEGSQFVKHVHKCPRVLSVGFFWWEAEGEEARLQVLNTSGII